MEIQWYLDRYRLRREHPEWSQRRLAAEVGYSRAWVRKWSRRFDEADPEDEAILHSRSRAPHHPPEPIAPEVVREILRIRDDSPEGLRRVPGPLAIKYYLGRVAELKEKGYRLPRSTATIWRILDEHQRIIRRAKIEHTPLTRAEPLAVMQMDFKEVSGVRVEQSSKKQHQVETLNIVDTGTSILIDNPVRSDFNASTVIGALARTFARWEVPKTLAFDRDPRFVGSWSADEYPSALMRFLMGVGVEIEIHPPHRPDKNGYVERFNRSYKEEVIQIYRPETLQQVEEMNRDFGHHYNFRRPHQGLSCGNQPPRVAFAQLPSLPPLPDQIDPDAWLDQIDGQFFKRRLDASGRFQLGQQRYYVRRALKGHPILVQIDAPQRQLQIHLADQLIKTIPLKGLFNGLLPFRAYLALIQQEALSEWQRYRWSKRRYTALS